MTAEGADQEQDERRPTTVIHVRDYRPGDGYIGRRTTTFTASRWANPFHITVAQTRDQAIIRYEEYIRRRIADDPENFNLEDLRGKRLACWCHPKPCHGNVLVKLLSELEPRPAAASADERAAEG